jgi:hypothetical protein
MGAPLEDCFMTELIRQLMAQKTQGESARTRHLAILEAYYHSSQYAGLPRAWDETTDHAGSPVPFRSRRPSTVIPLPKLIVDCFVRGLWGSSRRPIATLAGEGGTDDNALLADVIREAAIYRAMREATRRALSIGAGLLVWRIREGRISVESWDPKHATPTFKPGCFPEIECVDYRFQYTREIDGKAVPFWHREVLDGARWVVYADVEVTAGKEPEWRQASAVDHGLGFCPAVWFMIGAPGENGIDGSGIYSSILGLFDDLNWTSSQMGRATFYNLDPQTVLTGVPDADLEILLKGGRNTWALPKDGEAKLLESNGSYVTQALERIEFLSKSILDACSVVKNDPEKISGAQSGSALELLLEPQLSRIDELREDIGPALEALLQQIVFALPTVKGTLRVRPITITAKAPRDVPIVLDWGSHLPASPSDAQTAASAVVQALNVGVLSRISAARYLAPYFGVSDVEADQKIADTERTEAEPAAPELTEAKP